MRAAQLFVAACLLSLTSCSDPPFYTKTVEKNHDVVLPCKASQSGDYFPTWSRGSDDILFIGTDCTQDCDGLKAVADGDNYALEITNAQPINSANYTCATSEPNTPAIVVYEVVVLVPPKVNVKEREYLVRQGEDLNVRCTASGNPTPSISWEREDGNMPKNVNVYENGVLSFKSITPAASGTYKCIGKNKYGNQSHFSVTIKVVSDDNSDSSLVPVAPTVTIDRTYIPVTIGSSVNLTCRYSGIPTPQADWLLDGHRLNKIKQNITEYSRVEGNHTTTNLVLTDVGLEHFGEYTCSVSNNVATTKSIIFVSGRPGPPTIKIVGDNEFMLTVESVYPILEYKILYRLAGEDFFLRNHSVLSNAKQDQSGSVWQRTIKLDFLKPNTEYELQATGVNKLGAGALAKDYIKHQTPKLDSEEFDNKLSSATSLSASLVTLVLVVAAVRL